MPHLNYHHLRYFWMIANEASLSRAAVRLNVSPSALSVQLRQLEEQFGLSLFERQGKRLKLTEAGRIALDYAGTIFRAGEELMSTLQGQGGGERKVLRVGAITTLSRNFQLGLLRPMLHRTDVEVVIRSGSMRELLAQLEAQTLDLVLANQPAPRDAATPWNSHLLDEQPVSLVGRPAKGGRKTRLKFPDDLRNIPVVLPSVGSEIRAAFDTILAQADIRPTITAEVDDMAMMRLLARECDGVALVPPIVVQDELRSGILIERARLRDVHEPFYAIVPSRRFPHPLLRDLLPRKR